MKTQPDLEPVWKKDMGKLMYEDRKTCKLMKDPGEGTEIVQTEESKEQQLTRHGRSGERLEGPKKNIFMRLS